MDQTETELLNNLWLIHRQPGLGLETDFDRIELEFEQGQLLQTHLMNRWLAHGKTLGGWKLGMTSGASRNAMGEGVRPFGFILSERIVPSGGELNAADLHRGQIENELCFLIGRDFPSDGSASRQDAVDCVEALLPAFEINQKRLPPDACAGLRVADNLSNWGIVIGTPVSPHDDLDDLRVSLTTRDGEVLDSVASPGHIDDHYETLATLANRLARYHLSLDAGQYVITGAYGKTPFAQGHYVGRFDCGIGDVDIRLS